MAVEKKRKNVQQIRLLYFKDRERARHNGREGGAEKVFPHKQEDLQQSVYDGLLFGLFQRYGEKSRKGLKDYMEYAAEKASVEELKMQNSYFINGLYKDENANGSA